MWTINIIFIFDLFYVCMYVCMYVYKEYTTNYNVCVCMCVCVCHIINTNTNVNINSIRCSCVCVCVCMCVYVCVYMCVCICVCTYIPPMFNMRCDGENICVRLIWECVWVCDVRERAGECMSVCGLPIVYVRNNEEEVVARLCVCVCVYVGVCVCVEIMEGVTFVVSGVFDPRVFFVFWTSFFMVCLLYCYYMWVYIYTY